MAFYTDKDVLHRPDRLVARIDKPVRQRGPDDPQVGCPIVHRREQRIRRPEVDRAPPSSAEIIDSWSFSNGPRRPIAISEDGATARATSTMRAAGSFGMSTSPPRITDSAHSTNVTAVQRCCGYASSTSGTRKRVARASVTGIGRPSRAAASNSGITLPRELMQFP